MNGGPPERIIIIRHGEKPATPHGPPIGIDADGTENEHSLSPRGWQRCGALAQLFTPAVDPIRPGLATPDHLIAPHYDGHNHLYRTHQTLKAISDRSGLTIDAPCPTGHEQDLAADILAHRSGTVLICWEHHTIPAIAAALPQTTSGTAFPTSWPDDRFDIIWSFTRGTDAYVGSYAFTWIPQLLLAGDTDHG